MASRREVEALNRGLEMVSSAARRDLVALFSRLDLSNPAAARDALLEAVPLISDRYGQAAATLACDWYEMLRRDAGLPDSFRARPADTYPSEAVAARVRSAAGHLFDGDLRDALDSLATSLDKYVKQPARDTVTSNAARDKAWSPGVARVPMGSDPCDFCLMLASRGAVYASEDTAGKTKKYHGNCNCVPTLIKSPRDYPAGYDPDALYEDYLARREGGTGTPRSRS